jgi:opacity protein-like surface antigen
MNKFALSVAMALASGTAAFAGGTVEPVVIIEPAAAPVMTAAHDWTGLYAGFNLGSNSGPTDWNGQAFLLSAPVGPAETGTFDLNGNTAGLQAGYNMQSGNMVYGIEGDYGWGDVGGTGAAIDPFSATPSVPSVNLDQMGSIRARVGFASGNILFFATAGWASASGSMGLTNLDFAGDDRTADITANGWTGGIGAEIALSDRLSVKGEYLDSRLTMNEVQFGAVPPADYLAVNGTVDIKTFKIGLNYAF